MGTTLELWWGRGSLRKDKSGVDFGSYVAVSQMRGLVGLQQTNRRPGPRGGYGVPFYPSAGKKMPILMTLLSGTPCPTLLPHLGTKTLAQVSRDLYLLYRIHFRLRTHEFHFLSRV